ncbi:hypothetical protein GIB67_001781 [Kingdonia uniflora]|uniref:Uncharacterized protein n=1 Tax=Kingdonia uniflora TaxID=39325 RepID=A0A7J7LBY8_9MAGN|nr:hypothetical protein GIB67_001781 [Kingdonia uniflora]
MRLNQNQLGGGLTEFHNASSLLQEILDLSNNNFEGELPESIFRLPRLTDLILFSNNFSKFIDPYMFQDIKNLTILDLSFNTFLSIRNSDLNFTTLQLQKFIMCTCDVKEFPAFLRNQEILQELDLSDNKIQGKIPHWIWKEPLVYVNLSHNFLKDIELPAADIPLNSLVILDLHSNSDGSFPILPPNINFLSVSDNKLVGGIPLSVCNSTSLAIFDLSHNQMSSLIPQCLSDSGSLSALNLRGNNFHGNLPHNFTNAVSLRALDIYGNHIEGKLPRSFVSCKTLETLDLGSNQINDTYPFWLEDIPTCKFLF